jgi:nucleoside-diphosphate-sugar epimerase
MIGFTVFGANGFIGRHVVAELRRRGQNVATPMRTAPVDGLGELGHVIYCAGLTADFRTRPYDTMEAHVTLPSRLLQTARFASFLYLSSTRLYGAASTGRECAVMTVDPSSPSDLYNLSKLAGEAMCLNSTDPAVRVARLSNVYGAEMFAPGADTSNFLASVVADAVRTGHVALGSSPDSAKDYVHIDDVVDALIRISTSGTSRIYNVATGRNVANRHVMDLLGTLTGCTWAAADGAPLTRFPRICTKALAGLFSSAGADWQPASLADRMNELVTAAAGGAKTYEGAVA